MLKSSKILILLKGQLLRFLCLKSLLSLFPVLVCNSDTSEQINYFCVCLKIWILLANCFIIMVSLVQHTHIWYVLVLKAWDHICKGYVLLSTKYWFCLWIVGDWILKKMQRLIYLILYIARLYRCLALWTPDWTKIVSTGTKYFILAWS